MIQPFQKEEKNLVVVSSKIDESIREVIENLAKDDDRTVSYKIARLLESHPEVKAKLASETNLAVCE